MQRQVTVRFSVAWWFRWYIAGVVATSRMIGLDPDISKVAAWALRATTIKVIRCT